MFLAENVFLRLWQKIVFLRFDGKMRFRGFDGQTRFWPEMRFAVLVLAGKCVLWS